MLSRLTGLTDHRGESTRHFGRRRWRPPHPPPPPPPPPPPGRPVATQQVQAAALLPRQTIKIICSRLRTICSSFAIEIENWQSFLRPYTHPPGFFCRFAPPSSFRDGPAWPLSRCLTSAACWFVSWSASFPTSRVPAIVRASKGCFSATSCISRLRHSNERRRNYPLRRGDGEEVPFAGHALELVSAAVFELES
jgi:hypothetical protein